MAKKQARDATQIVGTIPPRPAFTDGSPFLFAVVLDAPPSVPLSGSDVSLERPAWPGTFSDIEVCAGPQPTEQVIKGTYASSARVVDGRGRSQASPPDIQAIGNLTITITVNGKPLKPKTVKVNYSKMSP